MVVFLDSKSRDEVLDCKRILRASTLARQPLTTTQLGLVRPIPAISRTIGVFSTPDSTEKVEIPVQKSSSLGGSLHLKQPLHVRRAGKPRLGGVSKRNVGSADDLSSIFARASNMANLGTLTRVEEPAVMVSAPPGLRDTTSGVGLLASLSPRLLPRSTTATRSPSQMSAMVFFANQQQQTTEVGEAYKLMARRSPSDGTALVDALNAALAQSAQAVSPTSPKITASVSTPSSPTIERRSSGRARAASFNIRADENPPQPSKERPTLDDLIKQGYGEREMPGTMEHPMFRKKKDYVPTKV
eukprot:comp21187_c0_seq1/m.28764 comp21187_c0_seq1/g.28764  ORF comp21187_c0_seq1/g.28764 comp21187_c0_seq1/m.28764 type:complete len:300 (-) comp21187_c0_seq1:961-1860(-)